MSNTNTTNTLPAITIFVKTSNQTLEFNVLENDTLGDLKAKINLMFNVKYGLVCRGQNMTDDSFGFTMRDSGLSFYVVQDASQTGNAMADNAFFNLLAPPTRLPQPLSAICGGSESQGYLCKDETGNLVPY